jgi:transcriptional regulator with XRE-family HTH domain
MDSKKTLATSPRRRGAKPGYRGLSANQVVAYNLARARELRGLTQDEAAELLAPFLGVRWSKASFSQAERSFGGKVVRKFDADEIVAFARAFDLPVTWFYLPPPSVVYGTQVKLSAGGAKERDQEIGLLVDLVFGEERHQQLFEDRLGEFVAALSPARLTRSQRQVGALAAAREKAVFSHHLGEMEEWRTWLRTVADHLENIERRVREAPAEGDA